MNRIIIGIDPGVKTGIALFDPELHKLTLLTMKIHQAFDEIARMNNAFPIEVVIENPNLWTHFSKSKNAHKRLQGAGSIKRDYSAWVDFLNAHKILFRSVRPDKQRNALAVDKETFKRITDYQDRSSEHARCAALLVWR